MMTCQLMNQRELFEWLQALDLSHYFQPLLQNGFENLRICAEMGESDLELIGVRDIHERIELLQAIRQLRRTHFGQEAFTVTSSGNRVPQYLEYDASAHFQNGDNNDELKYCLQKRYLPSSGGSGGNVEDSSCNGDYQDIDDCDCGPFYREPFYEVALSPRRLQLQRSELLFPNDLPGTPGRKYPNKSHLPTESSDRTQLRADHLFRRGKPPRPFGPLLSSVELTQESGRTHLYGSPSFRKVESEDLDSSSGIEPDFVSRKLKNSASTNTGSSSTTTTPDEPSRDNNGWADSHKPGSRGSWYQPPPPNFGSLAKPFRNKSYGLDVLQLQTGLRPLKKYQSATSSPNPNTLSRRQREGVPTVSGLLSGIDNSTKTCYYEGADAASMSTNLNSREFDYEDCSTNTYEEISRVMPTPQKTPTRRQYPNPQYLEHVIVSTVTPPPEYGNDPTVVTMSPTKSRQIYTPGIYSPSSCLMDRDDIYDYAPPLQRNRHYQSSPAKCSPFRSKPKGGSKSVTTSGGPPFTPLRRSTSLITSHHSQWTTPTYVNVGKAWNSSTDGGGNGPKVLSFPSSPSSQSSNGCRTLANLSKLSRRLGLGKLFRTLRMEGSSARRNVVLTKPRITTGTNLKNDANHQRSEDERQIASMSNIQDYTAVNTPLSSLPSNERIIETINRLKFEELQKRKERIAQEHQLEQGDGPGLKVSPPPSPTVSPGKNAGPTPSRFSNPMKAWKKNKSQTEVNGLEEDSIEALADDFLPLPGSSSGAGGSGGTSPSKSLLSKVKELGARNHKKLRRFSFSSKSSQSENLDDSRTSYEIRRGSDFIVSPTKRTTPAIQILGSKIAQRNSSEEEFSSLPGVHQRSLSICDIEEYNGPIIGKARALVDYVSSPYDLHALSYKKDDVLEIIEKKPTGNWKGRLNNKVGYFKFINVQVLPELKDEDGTMLAQLTSSLDSASFHYSSSAGFHGRRGMKATSPLISCDPETRQEVANVINGIRKENAALLQLNGRRGAHDDPSPGSTGGDQATADAFQHLHQSHPGSYQKRNKSLGRRSSSSLKKERPRSVGDLLKRINLEEHIPLFILHGFESLDLFKELEEEDLDRLNILEVTARAKIMTAVELLRDYDATEEIPPIIIPTYSYPPSQNNESQDYDDEILTQQPNITRGVKAVRDSGVFLKCDDKEEEDPEVEEIILCPSNLPINSLNPSDKFLMANHLRQQASKQMKPAAAAVTVQKPEISESNMTQFSSLEEHYGEVRQRFLHAKSLFESANAIRVLPTSVAPSMIAKPGSSEQFHYCEKSSDSGISLGANSPPPNANGYE